MASEIEFLKYRQRGYGYHWDLNSMHIKKMNSFVKARYLKCIMLLEDKIGSFCGKKIIDLGCGDGVLTYELSRRNAESYGVDISADAIGFAKQKHASLGSTASFYVESCIETHFNNSFFDAVVSSDVIEHLLEPIKLLKEIDRILKPGGVAIISTPIRLTEFPLDKMHQTEWFMDEFINLIKDIFCQAEFEYSHPVFWTELIGYSYRSRLMVNFLSYFRNPFLQSEKWRYFSMQYAIVKKI